MDEAREEQLEQARKNLTRLRELVENSLQQISQQRTSLRLLEAAILNAQPLEAQKKALRQLMVHHMALLMQREQMQPLLPELEGSIAKAMTDLRAELDQFRYLSALAETTEIVNSSLDIAEVLEYVMDTAVNLIKAERGYLMLLDPETDELSFKVARNLDRKSIDSAEFEISRTIVESVAADGKSIMTTDAQDDPRFKGEESVIGFKLRSILCVPLKAKDKLIGVIYTDNRLRKGLFKRSDHDLLVAFANEAAVAIDNARLFENVSIAKNLMQNVFASISSGVITVDENNRISLFNQAAENILCRLAEASIGENGQRVLGGLHGDFMRLAAQVRETRTPVGAHEMDVEIEGKGVVNLSLNVAPLVDEGNPFGVAMVLNDVTESKRFARERAMVKRYLPSQLVDSLADLNELRLGGARQEVSIFFADIRGFTSYSEVHSAVEVVDAINVIFGLVHGVISSNDGIVDKYMGDAVMSHYNAPLLPRTDHAWLAVKTAWEAQQVLRDYRAAHPGRDRLEIGIGVNTGEAVAGNVGASDHMDYTLIGDAVNLAKRLQENAKANQILLGHRAYELVRDRVDVKILPSLTVKGRVAAEQVYELCGLAGNESCPSSATAGRVAD